MRSRELAWVQSRQVSTLARHQTCSCSRKVYTAADPPCNHWRCSGSREPMTLSLPSELDDSRELSRPASEWNTQHNRCTRHCYYYHRRLLVGTCESFFSRSNRISNRIGRPIRFRIEFSNRIGRRYSEYLINSIGIYFVFVTNESDARNWVLVIHFNSVLKRVKLCRCNSHTLL